VSYLNYRAYVDIDPANPRGWGECDTCGHYFQLEKLAYQVEWMGTAIKRTGFRVCRECLDKPNEQLRTILLPPDPVPLKDPRPPKYHDPAPAYPYTAAEPQVVSIGGFLISMLPPTMRAHLASQENLVSDPAGHASDGTPDFLPVRKT